MHPENRIACGPRNRPHVLPIAGQHVHLAVHGAVELQIEALLGAVRAVLALGQRRAWIERRIGLALIDRRPGVDAGVALADVQRSERRIVLLRELRRDARRSSSSSRAARSW